MKRLARVYGGKINPNFYADGNLTPRGEKAINGLFSGSGQSIQESRPFKKYDRVFTDDIKS